MIESFLGVFGLALIELWAAIPLGFHLKLHPVLLIVAASAGALGGAAAAMFVGDGLRRLMFWRKKEKAEAGRLSQWLAAKGPWAIGLLGPLLIGRSSPQVLQVRSACRGLSRWRCLPSASSSGRLSSPRSAHSAWQRSTDEVQAAAYGIVSLQGKSGPEAAFSLCFQRVTCRGWTPHYPPQARRTPAA